MKQEYKAKLGATFGNKDAQVIGDALNKLNVITPENIVNEASNRKSPIHKYFEWNNSKAAEEYRLQQARLMTNHIVVVMEIDNEPIEVRAFHSVKDNGNKFYVTTIEVIENENYRAQLVNEMIAALKSLTYKMILFKDKL